MEKTPWWAWIGGFVIVGTAVGVIGHVQGENQQREWDANSGTQQIQISGPLQGQGWALSSTATLETSGEFSETWLEVYVSRDADSGSRAPQLQIEIPAASLKCVVNRNYLWSTRTGSSLTLPCNRHVLVDELPTLTAAILTRTA
ncbi:hypothetical protein ACF044_11395 [Microbacterium sp. NPDC016588]